MTLREKRCLFSELLAKLILRIVESGNEVAVNEVYRDPRIAELNAREGKGIRNSVHTLGLAADLNLYAAGVYLTSGEAHRPYGEWWEQQHALCRWGGRFNDGNHYSIEHNGVK